MSLRGAGTPSRGRGAEAKPHSAQGNSHLQFPLVSAYAPLRALVHEAPRRLCPGDPCTWSYSKTPTGMEPAAQHPMGPSVVRWWDQRARTPMREGSQARGLSRVPRQNLAGCGRRGGQQNALRV